MKIAIVGAGIIGVTTAYELAADGHDVTVFERRGAAALETSFANAGVVAPGYVTPWAQPGMQAKVARYLFSRHAPVRVAWPITLRAPRPIDEAISTAGGVRLEALDERLMLNALPGVFCAGEMLDWEAPTGGYLLSACFASGRVAGQGVLDWWQRRDHDNNKEAA